MDINTLSHASSSHASANNAHLSLFDSLQQAIQRLRHVAPSRCSAEAAADQMVRVRYLAESTPLCIKLAQPCRLRA